MKPIINIVGVILIVLGIATLAYRQFNYTETEKIAQIGELQVTAKTEKTIDFPPLLGGLSLASGIVLLVIGNINRKKK